MGSAFYFGEAASELTSQIDKRARWGILLEMFSFAALWQGKFWEQTVPEVAGGLFDFVFCRGGCAVVEFGTGAGATVENRTRD